jgi:SNF2 family DNA or RNA helicase
VGSISTVFCCSFLYPNFRIKWLKGEKVMVNPAIQFSHTPDGQYIRIRFPYNADWLLAVKQIPNRKWQSNGDDKYWEVPALPDSLSALMNFAEACGATLPKTLIELLSRQIDDQQLNLAMSEATKASADVELHALPDTILQALRPFQMAGLEYMLKNRRVLLGDDMGLGKTIQALAAVESLGAYPCLVICPASLKYNWKREIDKWLPERAGHVEILNGKEPDKRGDWFVIVNYDILKKHSWAWSIPWRAVIVDESHYIKNRKAQRTNFVLEITKNCENVFLLSGTPILNKPIDLATQLQALRRLDTTFGGFWPFAHHFCNAYKSDYGWVFDGAANLDELQTKLRQTCYIRRDKKTVLPELPEKTRQVIPVQISNAAEYDKAENELFDYIKENGRLEQKFVATLEGYAEDDKQSAISQYRMDKAQRAMRAEVLVGIETLKQVAAKGKLKLVQNWVEDFLENNPDEKLVVFAIHRDIIEAVQHICAELYAPALVLTGETPPKERDRFVQLFQNDKACRVFLSNIQAGGLGITLTAASHVLFVEYAWNSSTMEQAEDRLYRIGQKNAVNVYWLAGMDTIDEMLIDTIESKRRVIHEAIEGEGEIKVITRWLEERHEHKSAKTNQ